MTSVDCAQTNLSDKDPVRNFSLQRKKMNFGDDNTEEAQTLKDTLEAIARAFSTGEKNDFPALSMAVGFSGDLYRKK